MNKKILVLAFLVLHEKLWACVGCGQESYTPKMLLVGTLFSLLPLSLVLGIAWIVRRETRNSRLGSQHDENH